MNRLYTVKHDYDDNINKITTTNDNKKTLYSSKNISSNSAFTIKTVDELHLNSSSLHSLNYKQLHHYNQQLYYVHK